MSTQELATIIDALNKPRKKADNTKIWIAIFGFTGTILTIGAVGGNWIEWRSNISDWKLETTTTIKNTEKSVQEIQAIQNEKERRRIDTIKTR